MRINVLASVILLAAVSLPVSAYCDPAQTTDPTQTASGSDPNEIVCKSMAPTTGTRLGGGRECHTQREWDDRQKASQKALMDKQMHGLQSCIGSCGG